MESWKRKVPYQNNKITFFGGCFNQKILYLKSKNNLLLYRLKLKEPERVHLPGYRIGLTVALDNDLNDWASTTGRSNGWKVRKKAEINFPLHVQTTKIDII